MKINIGTSLGNIVGVEIDKKFEELTYDDIRPFVIERFGNKKLSVYGWAPHVISLQKFMEMNIPDWDSRSDVKQYISLKECLADENEYDRVEAADLFHDFLVIKDRLFDEAMGAFLSKRGHHEYHM